MKLPLTFLPLGRRSAFTMVEIALCLAIIGFALVAIIGVLPAGLNVQRENREETIITQEANYFMDAIRNGARGLDELTNNVVGITNYWQEYDTSGLNWQPNGGGGTDAYTRTVSRVTSTTVANNAFPLTNGFHIISLLSMPKFERLNPALVRSNHVVAYVRALTGSASDKFPQTNTLVLDLGLNYRMVAEVHDVPQPVAANNSYVRSLRTNLHEVRLRFSWPILPRGKLGNGRQTFRTLAGGKHETWIAATNGNHPVFFFNPSLY